LRVGFTVLPIVMGIDKVSNTLVNWEHYLAPAVSSAAQAPHAQASG
jgi:hypothetical protein